MPGNKDKIEKGAVKSAGDDQILQHLFLYCPKLKSRSDREGE